MNKLWKWVAVLIVAAFGILWLIPAQGVPILAYHMVNDLDEVYSITPAMFEKHMTYLEQEGYTAISLAQLVAAWSGGEPVPAKSVIITFDDGYSDNYEIALPIMARHGMKGTVFVIAGHVGQPNYMTWEQIKAMQAQGTEIGSHTLSHVALSEVAPEVQLQEVQQSKFLLEQALGTPVEFLAYPYGKFTTELFTVLQQSGYQGACTGKAGLNKPGMNPFKLKRVNIPQPHLGFWEFRLRLWRAEMQSKLRL